MTEALHWSPAARTHSLGRAGSEGLAPALDRCSSGAAGLCRWSRGGGGEGQGGGRAARRCKRGGVAAPGGQSALGLLSQTCLPCPHHCTGPTQLWICGS